MPRKSLLDFMLTVCITQCGMSHVQGGAEDDVLQLSDMFVTWRTYYSYLFEIRL